MPTFASEDIELLVTPRQALLPAPGRPVWPLFAWALVAVFFGQWGSVILWVPPYQQSTIWIPGSILLAILLLTEPRLWLGVLVAGGIGEALLFASFGLVAPGIAIVLSLESMVVTIAVAWICRRVVGEAISLTTFREFVLYLPTVVALGALLASVAYIGGAAIFNYRPPSFLVWRTFALSVVLGYLMVTPTAIILVRTAKHMLDNPASRRFEAVVLGVLLVLAASVVFGPTTERDMFWPVFALVIPPLLLWAALRFGTLGAAGSVLLVTVISTFGTAQGIGPFDFESAADNTLSLQLFMLGTALPLIGLAVILGEQRRTVGALRDTHTRLRDLNRDLLAARESESGRIAGELHDDIGQRLALVSIGLSHLRKSVLPGESDRLNEIFKLQEQTSSISRSVRELSHELHPTALQHTGVAVALQMACEEVAQVTRLDVQFAADGETGDLQPQIALALFRVAQEGLSNAVQHAGGTLIRVSLQRRKNGVMLTISDDGRGFSLNSVRGHSGLGLHSMVQRISLVGGAVTIDSTPGAGTKIRAQVPLQGGPIA